MELFMRMKKNFILFIVISASSEFRFLKACPVASHVAILELSKLSEINWRGRPLMKLLE